MLGHKVLQVCQRRFETWGTIRGPAHELCRYDMLPAKRVLGGVDATEIDSVKELFKAIRPDAVVNCIGIVKQSNEANDPVSCIRVNALFPHLLMQVAGAHKARVIHLSTDCVFSGRKGRYSEEDSPDPVDLYGRTKLLGELDRSGALTLRTSTIGRELRGNKGLVEWFLSNRGGKVKGYTRAVFSGLTTLDLARLIADLLENHPALEGIYHVAAEPISKCELLRLLKRAYALDIEIEAEDDIRLDRTLDGHRFTETTGWQAAAWPEMVRELAQDATPYHEWRKWDAL